jgi:hypothetical protein
MVHGILTVGPDKRIKRIEVTMSTYLDLAEARKLQEDLVDKLDELNRILIQDKERAMH